MATAGGRSVGVIGAGPSGLVACKVLREAGLETTVYEAGDRVGGHWVIDNTSGTSAAYRSLRTNTHTAMCRLSDFDFPADYQTHTQMAAWFDSYADHFGLRDAIRLDARVRRAEPRRGGGWTLVLEDGEGAEHDALVVAAGNLWDAREPDFAGRLDGPVIHSKHYRDPKDPLDLTGRSVLVVGLGNTACELAVELSEAGAADRVLLSARSGQTILPRLVAPIPHPSEPLTGVLARLPRPLRNAAFHRVFPRVMRRFTARLPAPESLGLPPAPRDPFAKRVVINDHLLARIEQGRIRPKPGVARLAGAEVHFDDGSRERVDAMITATGYRFSLPLLSEAVLGGTAHDLPLYRGLMHPRRHDLFVIGVMNAICSIWPRSEQQMRFIAPLLAGEYTLPSQAAIDRESYPVLRVPFDNCQFHTHDLQRELARGRRRAARARWGRGLRARVQWEPTAEDA